MKEHETYYPCVPFGAVEYNEDVPVCAFCGFSYPKRDHLAQHHVALCIGGSKSPARKSRKSLMVSHLAQHGVLDPAASDLADKWQCKRNKRAFSCGFCVKSFSTIMEQLNHVDNEHFKNGEDKSSWDNSTVIKGLLHQPKVHKYWQKILASNSSILESGFHWDTAIAEILQSQLENRGDESGADLAMTAFKTCAYSIQTVGPNVSMAITIPVLQHMTIGQFSTIGGSQTCHEEAPPKSPIAKPGFPASQEPVLDSRHHPATSTWNYNDPETHLHVSQSGHTSSQPTSYHGSCESDGVGIPGSSQDSQAFDIDSDFDCFNPSLYSIPTGPQSLESESESYFDEHARLQGRMDGNGHLISAQLSLTPYEGSASIPTANIMASPHSRLVNQDYVNNRPSPTSQPLDLEPRNHNRSPDSLEKPLPALPTERESYHTPATQGRSISPPYSMDLEFS